MPTQAPEIYSGGSPVEQRQGSQSSPRRQLRLAFYLTLLVLAVEVAGGILSHSLALFSDAGHVLTDILALGLAWFAAAQAERPPTDRMTYGYHRVGILSALVNSVALVLIAALIAFEAYQRFISPQPVNATIMAVTAVIPILLNFYIATRLHGHSHNLNARVAALHVIGDLGASLGVIVAAVLIALTGALWIDPLVSLLIALLIAGGAVRILMEALNILLEAAPKGADLERVGRTIERVKGVRGVHDLHVWSIGGGMAVLSCHVVIKDIPPSKSALILDEISRELRAGFGIVHTTIQFESEAHIGHMGYCACPPGSRTRYCDIQPLEHEHTHSHTHNHTHDHTHDHDHDPHDDPSSVGTH